jgi:hypothetical protein
MDRKAFGKNECNWKRLSVVENIAVRKVPVHKLEVAENYTVRSSVNNPIQVVGNKIKEDEVGGACSMKRRK